MKKVLKRVMSIMLVVVILLSINVEVGYASSVSGKTETNAIELKSGKKKTKSFWTGTAAPLYYVLATTEQGKISVSVSAEKLGTNVTIQLRKMNVENWDQTKEISYNKSKKITAGTMKSEYMLPKGNYIIQITPGKALSSNKKISVTATFTPSSYDDVELNNTEETAQKMDIYKNKTYKMYLSGVTVIDDTDLMDCFQIKAKKDETLKITLSSKINMDGVKLLLRKKTTNGYETVKAYDVKNKKLSETIDVKKGTYYLKVWYADESNKQQLPYTIKCVAQ